MYISIPTSSYAKIMSSTSPPLYTQIQSFLLKEGTFTYNNDFVEEGIEWKQYSSSIDCHSFNAFVGFNAKGETYFADTANCSDIKMFSTFDEWKVFHAESMAKYPALIDAGLL